jgi:hypothetical protein
VIGGLVFSTILSLVFVPAMFMLMDDVGSLIWRFGKKLVVSNNDDAEHGDHHTGQPAPQPPAPPATQKPSTIAHSPAAK